MFYDELQKYIMKVPTSVSLIPLGDRNGHVGKKLMVLRTLELTITNNLFFVKTCFPKRESHCSENWTPTVAVLQTIAQR